MFSLAEAIISIKLVNMWHLYIIKTRSGKLYTGITTDPERRFQEHITGKSGAKFFRTDPPSKIVYREQFLNRSEASKRENAIKKMSRQKKLELIKEA